ncbi:MAG: hypothetical protein ACK4PR_00195, partial [Gammaproteobacteria bacterium]
LAGLTIVPAFLFSLVLLAAANIATVLGFGTASAKLIVWAPKLFHTPAAIISAIYSVTKIGIILTAIPGQLIMAWNGFTNLVTKGMNSLNEKLFKDTEKIVSIKTTTQFVGKDPEQLLKKSNPWTSWYAKSINALAWIRDLFVLGSNGYENGALAYEGAINKRRGILDLVTAAASSFFTCIFGFVNGQPKPAAASTAEQMVNTTKVYRQAKNQATGSGANRGDVGSKPAEKAVITPVEKPVEAVQEKPAETCVDTVSKTVKEPVTSGVRIDTSTAPSVIATNVNPAFVKPKASPDQVSQLLSFFNTRQQVARCGTEKIDSSSQHELVERAKIAITA